MDLGLQDTVALVVDSHLEQIQPNTTMLQDAQEFLRRENLPAWLIYDYLYLGCNPALAQIAPSPPSGHGTRPVFLLAPADGSPRQLTHHVDSGKFADAVVDTVVYRSRATLENALRDALAQYDRVAME